MKAKIAYNLEEAAEAVGYSERTIRRAINDNKLVARYGNSKPVILADDLRAWVESFPTEKKDEAA